MDSKSQKGSVTVKNANHRKPVRRIHPFSNMGPVRFGGNPEDFLIFAYEDPEVDADLNRSDPPRSKRGWPYSYDPFTIWGEPSQHKDCNTSDYTDRLSEWDHNKYERIAAEVYKVDGEPQFPFREHNCRGDLIEKFLQRYYDNPRIKLLRVVEYCNSSTGFTTYRLDYNNPQNGASK